MSWTRIRPLHLTHVSTLITSQEKFPLPADGQQFSSNMQFLFEIEEDQSLKIIQRKYEQKEQFKNNLRRKPERTQRTRHHDHLVAPKQFNNFQKDFQLHRDQQSPRWPRVCRGERGSRSRARIPQCTRRCGPSVDRSSLDLQFNTKEANNHNNRIWWEMLSPLLSSEAVWQQPLVPQMVA